MNIRLYRKPKKLKEMNKRLEEKVGDLMEEGDEPQLFTTSLKG